MAATLAGKTLVMSGGSRGIGLAIALRAARDGANVVMLAKTAVPHPKLEGTVFTATQRIAEAGGQGLAVVAAAGHRCPAAAVAAADRGRFAHRGLRHH